MVIGEWRIFAFLSTENGYACSFEKPCTTCTCTCTRYELREYLPDNIWRISSIIESWIYRRRKSLDHIRSFRLEIVSHKPRRHVTANLDTAPAAGPATGCKVPRHVKESRQQVSDATMPLFCVEQCCFCFQTFFGLPVLPPESPLPQRLSQNVRARLQLLQALSPKVVTARLYVCSSENQL